MVVLLELQYILALAERNSRHEADIDMVGSSVKGEGSLTKFMSKSTEVDRRSG